MKIALYMPKYHSESYDFFKNVFYKHGLLLTHSVDCLEEDINLVIIRNNGMDYSDLDLDQFEARGLRTLNSIRSHRLSRDKLKSLDYFKQLNLKIPEFMKDKRDFPYIQKTIRGMQGRGVELIKSQNDLISSPYRNDDRKFFQRYLMRFSVKLEPVIIISRDVMRNNCLNVISSNPVIFRKYFCNKIRYFSCEFTPYVSKIFNILS